MANMSWRTCVVVKQIQSNPNYEKATAATKEKQLLPLSLIAHLPNCGEANDLMRLYKHL